MLERLFSCASVPQGGVRLGGGQHQEAQQKSRFAFKVRAPIDAANGPMSGPHPAYRWRFVTPGAAGLAAGTGTNRQRKTMHGWSPIPDAWKLNADAQRAVVL